MKPKHAPDLVDNIHPWLLHKSFGDKAFRYNHFGWTGLYQLRTKVISLYDMRTQRFCCVHHGLQQTLVGEEEGKNYIVCFSFVPAFCISGPLYSVKFSIDITLPAIVCPWQKSPLQPWTPASPVWDPLMNCSSPLWMLIQGGRGWAAAEENKAMWTGQR